MRNTIVAIISLPIILFSTNFLKGQGSMKETLHSLFVEIRDTRKELAVMENKLKETQDKIKKSDKVHREVFLNLYNDFSKEKQKLLLKIGKLENEAEKIRSENTQLFKKNSELKDSLDKSLIELENHKKLYLSYKSDADKFAISHSYFDKLEVGYQEGKKIAYKKVDGLAVNDNLWASELTYISYSGRVYDSVKGSDMIAGKVLVYVNGKLKTEIDDTIRKSTKDVFENFETYEISSEKKLSNSLPEGSEIQIGFISSELYYKLTREDLESFWMASSNHLFYFDSERKVTNNIFIVPDFVEKRRTSKKKVIIVKSNEIDVYFSDFGDEDDDVISLKLNESWIIKKENIEKKEKHLKIILNQNSVNFLLLHAEEIGNRGTPCTVRVRVVFDNYDEETIDLRSKLDESQYIEIINKTE